MNIIDRRPAALTPKPALAGPVHKTKSTSQSGSGKSEHPSRAQDNTQHPVCSRRISASSMNQAIRECCEAAHRLAPHRRSHTGGSGPASAGPVTSDVVRRNEEPRGTRGEDWMRAAPRLHCISSGAILVEARPLAANHCQAFRLARVARERRLP